MDDKEPQSGLVDTLRGRPSRRQVLKGGAAVGAAVVWAVPVVEVLTTASASASGLTSSPYTFPSWAYVIYTTTSDAAMLSASTVLSAGFQYPGSQSNAANPKNSQTGNVNVGTLGKIALSLAQTPSTPVPVGVTPYGASEFTAGSTTGSAPLQEVAGLISPTSGSDITILGAFAFAGAYEKAYGSKLIFVAAGNNQVQLPSG